jgi:hypothetical protein
MKREKRKLTARLFLNDHDVGLIEVKGWDDAWGLRGLRPRRGL